MTQPIRRNGGIFRSATAPGPPNYTTTLSLTTKTKTKTKPKPKPKPETKPPPRDDEDDSDFEKSIAKTKFVINKDGTRRIVRKSDVYKMTPQELEDSIKRYMSYPSWGKERLPYISES